MRLRVDLLITDLDYGGAEAQVVDLLTAFAQDEAFAFRLITLMPPVAFIDRLEQAGIPVLSLGMRRKWQAPLACLRLWWLLLTNRTRLVHAHMVHANLMARVCRIFLPRVRIISSAHSNNEGGRLRERLYALTDPLSNLNTNVSQRAVDRYVEVGASPRHKIRAVYNGIDTARFHPADPVANAEFTWVAVGRLEDVKGYDLLLEAAARLRDQGRRFQLRIVGQGSREQALKALSHRLGLDAVVTFAGLSTTVSAAYQASDAFVLASRYEGYGLVVAEAMACGLPVVATDCGGPREIVGDLGELVRPGDAGALAQGMGRVMDLPPPDRQRRGALGRERVVERFSLSSAVATWKDIYREVLNV